MTSQQHPELHLKDIPHHSLRAVSVGEYKTGGKSLTAIRALRDAHANKDQGVLQQCPGYDIKLHPLRELWLGDRMVLPAPYPHCTQVHFGPEWCNLLGPELREHLGRQVPEALVWTPF